MIMFFNELILKESTLPYMEDRVVHYSGVVISAMASPITGVSNVCSTVCSDADQRKHLSSAKFRLPSIQGFVGHCARVVV